MGLNINFSGKKHLTQRILGLGLCLIAGTRALAEPMLPASLEQGVDASKQVVIATYQGYFKAQKAEYFTGIDANYRVEQTLKGPALKAGEPLTVRYAFHDGSACMEPPDWKFDAKREMPTVGSRWVLLVLPKNSSKEVSGIYRGDFGRIPADEKHLNEVKNLISKSAKANPAKK